MTDDQYSTTKELLDRWAEWMKTSESTARGYPGASVGAPDARIHSIEDLEIEVDKAMVSAVHTAVYDLSKIDRDAIMLNYGLGGNGDYRWPAFFDQVFDAALWNLYKVLKTKIVC